MIKIEVLIFLFSLVEENCRSALVTIVGSRENKRTYVRYCSYCGFVTFFHRLLVIICVSCVPTLCTYYVLTHKNSCARRILFSVWCLFYGILLRLRSTRWYFIISKVMYVYYYFWSRWKIALLINYNILIRWKITSRNEVIVGSDLDRGLGHRRRIYHVSAWLQRIDFVIITA
jgi:hypothetical protein